MTIKHSKIGASSASRWMKCPGSVRLCESTPRRSSEYADEGTAAHALAELCLKPWVGNEAAHKLLTADEYLGAIVEGRPVSEEMIEAVNVYLDTIRDDYQPGDEQEIEVRFSLNAIHSGLFGTADRVRYRPSDQTLCVTDYKHGAGVAVEVDANPQLMYYAIGAAMRMHNRGLSAVELQVVQPRCPHPDGPVRTWSIDVTDLVEFAGELKAAALRTEDPNAPLVPGDHCRWCAAAGFCPALAKEAITVATQEFGPGIPYDAGDLSEALQKVPQVRQWLTSIETFAYDEAVAGRIPPGFKIVEKRATRKWRDDQQAIGTLKALKVPDSTIFEQSLRSVAQIEKLYGKKNMPNLAEAIVKESSGTSLAPLSDRRPAVAFATATDEFTAVGDEE